MYNIVSQNPGEISIVCIGPLTNLAIPMRYYKNFTSLLKSINIMGGNYCGRCT